MNCQQFVDKLLSLYNRRFLGETEKSKSPNFFIGKEIDLETALRKVLRGFIKRRFLGETEKSKSPNFFK